jgi:large conductance mechanosensitive channel
MLGEFKAFIMRGNLVQLAVAFVLGAAFATVVSAFAGMLLGAIGFVFGSGTPFQLLAIHKDGAPMIEYGVFIQACLTFLIVAFALFLVVKAYARWFAKEEAATTKPCPFCVTDIPLGAIRCPSCTSELPAAARA